MYFTYLQDYFHPSLQKQTVVIWGTGHITVCSRPKYTATYIDIFRIYIQPLLIHWEVHLCQNGRSLQPPLQLSDEHGVWKRTCTRLTQAQIICTCISVKDIMFLFCWKEREWLTLNHLRWWSHSVSSCQLLSNS